MILDCLTSGEPQPSVTFTYSDEDVTLNLQGHKVVGNSLHIDGTNVKPSYVCVAENRNGEAQATVSGRYTVNFSKETHSDTISEYKVRNGPLWPLQTSLQTHSTR